MLIKAQSLVRNLFQLKRIILVSEDLFCLNPKNITTKQSANLEEQSTVHSSTRTAPHSKQQGSHCWLSYSWVPLRHKHPVDSFFATLARAASGKSYCNNQPTLPTLLCKVDLYICLNNHGVTFSSQLCDTASENISLQDRNKYIYIYIYI